MARPHRMRDICGRPAAERFSPDGTSVSGAAVVVMSLDEFEALRLADVEGLYQEDAAECLGISRTTMGRLITSARGKLAGMLVHGYILEVDGGPVRSRCEGLHGCGERAGCGRRRRRRGARGAS